MARKTKKRKLPAVMQIAKSKANRKMDGQSANVQNISEAGKIEGKSQHVSAIMTIVATLHYCAGLTYYLTHLS